MNRRYLIQIFILMVLTAGISSCGIFKSKKCDCPSWGHRTAPLPPKRAA